MTKSTAEQQQLISEATLAAVFTVPAHMVAPSYIAQAIGRALTPTFEAKLQKTIDGVKQNKAAAAKSPAVSDTMSSDRSRPQSPSTGYGILGNFF